MRFDYQSPVTKFRTLRLRRIFNTSFIILGICCISIALLTKTNRNEIYSEKITLHAHKDAGGNNFLPKVEHQLIAAAKLPCLLEEQKEIWKSRNIQKGDSIAKIFSHFGISLNILHKVMASNPASKQLSHIHPGQTIHCLLSENNELKELRLSLSPMKTLHARNTTNGFKYYYEEKQITKQLAFSENIIKDSLFTAAQSAGLDAKLTMQLADIFGWDIDFALDIRENDKFKVLYEEEYLDNEKIDSGQIIAAEFVNQGKTYKAVRYTDDSGKTGFFTPDGFSLQKAFLRTPVNFTHISSHFSTGRHHPVLHKIRAHKGVDYAAPRGTPVKSAGDGKITFIGTRGGYGKTIEIFHGRKYSTLYAHLNAFSKELKEGTSVKQGQIIGYVGKTGLATGDHLHYEFRINGIHRDPLTVQLPRSLPVSDNRKDKFIAHAKNMLELLNSNNITKLANNG